MILLLITLLLLGFAYDGNPIYGPYGYTDPVDSTSAIKRIDSGYRKRTTRSNGPSVATYPLGSFTQDYYYADRLGDVDRNNGRFCVTPEYPDGVYAYFATEDTNGDPAYPYIDWRKLLCITISSKLYTVPNS